MTGGLQVFQHLVLPYSGCRDRVLLAPNVVFAAFGTGRKRQFWVLRDPPSLQPVFETLFISSLTWDVVLSSVFVQKLYDGVMVWKPACVCCLAV